MEFEECFPVWDKLTGEERETLLRSAVLRSAPKGTLLRSGGGDCIGLLVVRSGLLRAFMLSGEGKEVTLYRLFERDVCLFSASCIMQNVQFDVAIEAERDAEFWVIPTEVYKNLMDRSLPVANYTNQLMASHFSEVMWLVEQIMWKSFDKRLAEFLLQESVLDGSDTLRLTHDRIASHLGTAREVVTRMLRYFQSEGLVSLARGTVRITDRKRLRELAE